MVLFRELTTNFWQVKLCKVIDFVGFNIALKLIKNPKFVALWKFRY
jgi:hypothetical protein